MPSIRDTLTRLFSNDVVMSKSDDGEVQALDVNRMQAISTEYASGRYKRMYQGGYSRSSMGMSGLGAGGYGHGGGSDQSMHRIQLFQDYESMHADPIIASALDVYADEIATEDEYGRLLQVECDNGEIKGIIENLLFEILNVNMNLRWWARGMLKYGDFFMKLHIVDGGGVVNVTPLDVYMMAREQPETGAGQTMFYHEDVGEPWHQWEVAHFRLLSDSNFYPYGRAILENGRQIWKQLCMAEGSRVWTPDGGYKEIQDIEDGDAVLSYDPETGELVETEAHAAVKTGEKETFRVRTSNREFEATATHPVLTRSGEYVPVKDLESGDEIRIIGGLSHEGEYPNLSPEYATRVRVTDTEAAENALEENGKKRVACEVCGEKFKQVHVNHLKNHGITSADEYRSKFSEKTEPYTYDRFLSGRTTVDAETAERYVEDLNVPENALKRELPMGGKSYDGFDDPESFARFFGFMLGDGRMDGNTVAFALGDRRDKSDKYTAFLEREGFDTSVQYRGTTKAECRVHSVWLRRLMEDLDFRTGTKNKRVPQWAYEMPAEGRIAMLEGFADADGCEFKSGYKVGGINKDLLGDLKTLAEQSGYSVTNVTATGETSAGNMAYELKFRKDETRFTHHDSVGAYQKVRDIESVGTRDVYDIQVKNEHHNFVCEGAVVHNSLTEEAMLVHRIMRAPEKRVFKIDVGNISPDAIDSYMHQIIQDVQQTPLVDPQSGEYNLEFNLQNMLEDFYFPVRGDNTGTEVETLQGLDYQAIEDVEYLRKKLMSALRIPNAFLGYEQEIQGKSTLAQESLKFAENVRKLQKMMAAELEKIAAVHLIAKGYDVSDVTDFNIQLTDPSIIAEQERVDFLQKKIRVAGDAMDNKLFSSDYMLEHLFNMSEEEIIRERKRMVDDWKREFRKDQIEREGNDPVKTGRGFGTPSQLSDQGSTRLEPIAITGGGPESEGDDSNYGLRDLTPELGPDQSDVRPQFYQGGSPRAVNASKEKQEQGIITESLGLDEEFELRHESSYMSLSAVEEIDETAADHILEELE